MLTLLLLAAGTSQAWATGTKANLPTTRATLTNGYIYTVQSSMTISANSSGPGLTIPSSGTVTIYIPKGVTLTVNGSGRYAGIYIPSNSTLIITGEGTLNATAGNNGTGASGGAGSAGSVWQGSKWSSGNTGHASAGDGGTGGAGGNGGGAAIGGNGGAGGAAKAGPTGRKDIECRLDNSYINSGYAANTGNNGDSGTTMGTLYVMGTVTVTGTKGSQQTSSRSRGSDGAMGYYKWTHRYYAGGGGGGGYGGHGYIAPYAIGGGGAAGGSGASGGSGGFEWSKEGKYWWNETGSYGGNGAGYSSTRTIGSYNSQSGYKNDYWRGGASAYGGYAGSNGGNGTVYRIPATDNKPSVSGAYTWSNTTSYPAQVQATLTFNLNYDGSATPSTRVVYYGVKMNDVTIPTRAGYFFQGYYTAASGGTMVFDADGKPASSISTFAANTTLYAHWVYTHHDMYWDYSYENGGTYTNVSETDNANRVKYARLTFYNANGGVAKKVILTAADVTNKTDMTADFATHTTAHASITLATSGTQNLVGENVVIVSTKAEMSSFASYTFEPLATNNESATKAANWSATTNKETHATVLNFTGASGDNIYQQGWTVNIIGLQINPDFIYVKPLFKNAQGQWEEISQVANTTGVQCAKALETTTEVQGMGTQPVAIYTGSYPVWKHDAQSNDYEYAIGLVGFTLMGKTYYMNTQNEGAWEPHFTCPTNDTDLKYTATTNEQSNGKPIVYNVSAATIPVIRFAAGEGTLSDGTPFILVKGYGETVTDLATHYTATRKGYTFDGWKDNRDEKIYGTTSCLKLEGAHTLDAVFNANQYTITLDNGETMEDGNVTATYDAPLPAITAPSRTGYTFGGYYTEIDGGGTQYYNADGTSTSAKVWKDTHNITLYAKWTANTYTLTLDNAGVRENVAKIVTYGQPWPEVSIDAPNGKLFLGYYTEQNDQSLQYYNEVGHFMLTDGDRENPQAQRWTLTSDLTLYAHWVDCVAKIGDVIYTSLADAFEAAQDGETITLFANTGFSETITIADGRDVTLNLNGKTINATDYLQVTHGKLHITGEGTYTTSAAYALKAVGAATDQGADYSVITVDEGVTVNATKEEYGYAAMISYATTNHNASYGSKIVFNGKSEANLGLYVNGNIKAKEGTIPEVIVGPKADINSEDYAIYGAGYANYIINGKVTGLGGIEVKGGRVEINDGAVITATATEQSHETKGNASSTKGYALAAVANSSYAGALITVNGGTIKGQIISLKDETGDVVPSALLVKGGIFDQNPYTYVADDFKAMRENAQDGWYYIIPKTQVVVVSKDSESTDDQAQKTLTDEEVEAAKVAADALSKNGAVTTRNLTLTDVTEKDNSQNTVDDLLVVLTGVNVNLDNHNEKEIVKNDDVEYERKVAVVTGAKFDVTPVHIVDGVETYITETNQAITFRLPVDNRIKNTTVKAYHKHGETKEDLGSIAVQTSNGNKYIKLSSSTFSEYGYEVPADAVTTYQGGKSINHYFTTGKQKALVIDETYIGEQGDAHALKTLNIPAQDNEVKVEYKRTITNYWQSWYAPFSISNYDESLEFAEITGTKKDEEGKVIGFTYQRIEGSLEPNTCYVVRLANEESAPVDYTFTATGVNATKSESTYFSDGEDGLRYYFTGVYTAIKLSGNPYWALDLKGQMAYTDDSVNNYIENPMRFVMRIYQKGQDNSYTVVNPRGNNNATSMWAFMSLYDQNDIVTEIENTELNLPGATTIYDLQGRSYVQQPKSGIYVAGGKKIIRK